MKKTKKEENQNFNIYQKIKEGKIEEVKEENDCKVEIIKDKNKIKILKLPKINLGARIQE